MNAVVQAGASRARGFLGVARDQLSAERVLAASSVIIGPSMSAAVSRLSAPVRRLAAYHLGLGDEQGGAPEGTGKALRPALTLLACEALGGDVEEAVAAAVAVELVHNASLLHDDVIDRDNLRRHRTAVWAASGVPRAILVGDALFFLAVEVLAQAPDPLGRTGVPRLVQAVHRLIDGETEDLALEERNDFSLAEVTSMAAAKTGALIAEACALGALAAGAGADGIGHLSSYGAHLGLAFQLADDLLGIWGDPVVTGKPRLADLQARKKSAPVGAALAADVAAARELDGLYRQPGPLDARQLERAAGLVEAAGGRAWAVRESEWHVRKALGHLREAVPDQVAAEALAVLAHMAMDRTR